MSESGYFSANLENSWAPSAATWLEGQNPRCSVLSNVGASALPFQRWFHFKEAFAPTFVANMIANLPYNPQHIVDPFSGSGTTAITSRLLGLRSTSIELNPLMADVIRAKVTPASAVALRQATSRILRRLRPTKVDYIKPPLMPPTFVEPGRDNRYIFPEDVFATARTILRRSMALPETEARLVRIALASCLIGNSNVHVNGKGRRYRSNWRDRQPTVKKLLQQFEEACDRICEDLLDFVFLPSRDHVVLHGDAREQLSHVTSADTVICSPPYPNSFDYTDVYNVELWMLDYLRSPEDNRQLRSSTVRSHVQFRWPDCPGLTTRLGSPTLSRTINELEERRKELWDPNIPAMVTHYFNDMRSIFTAIAQFIVPSGHVIFAVGNSRYAHVTIDVPEILIELVRPLGFDPVRREAVRSMRTSAQHGGHQDLDETAISFVYRGDKQ